MATMGQFEEGNGLLPPLRESFLEIQVNKLIKEYLFSSTTEERATSLLYDGEHGSSELTVTKAWFTPPLADDLYAKDAVLRSACDAPFLQSVLHFQSLHKPHSIACIEDTNSNVNEHTIPPRHAHSSPAVDAMCDASLVMENEGKKLCNASPLSRVDTFPCAKKVELQVGAPCMADTEVKSSCKKPPRPPRLPKLPSNELGPSLTRCSSDSGAHLQSSRRVKLERKRKATAGSSGNTSIWALVFTVCFGIIMIAQGFLSEDSEGYAMYGSDASSPMESNMKASTLVASGEVNLAGAEGGGQASGIENLPVQSYVMRKVKAQHVSDMKHLELEAVPKS